MVQVAVPLPTYSSVTQATARGRSDGCMLRLNSGEGDATRVPSEKTRKRSSQMLVSLELPAMEVEHPGLILLVLPNCALHCDSCHPHVSGVHHTMAPQRSSP